MQIAIVPARGGSKRIPRKNIRTFGGRPMLAWPIRAARASGLFDEVVVSTDDDEIARIAEAEGALTPFRRPARLSDDIARTREVINHALRDAEARHGRRVSALCCVYATAAMITPDDLVMARAALDNSAGTDFVFAAAQYPHPVHRAMLRRDDGGVEMLFPEHAASRSQDLPEALHDAGLFYWGRRDAFLEGRRMFSERAVPFVLPRSRALDIDTTEDWDIAEALFSRFGPVDGAA